MGRMTLEGNNKFVWYGRFEEKDIPKRAGFRWDPVGKVWYTSDPHTASLLLKYADDRTRQHIESAINPPVPDISVVVPNGLSLFPYQEEGAKFILSKRSVLLADDMGLGKTAQVLAAINSDESIHRVLVVCPASVKLNWVREAKRWLTREFSVRYLSGKSPEPLAFDGNDLYIINYDIVSSWSSELSKHEWDLLVLDESHYLKNPKAKRTKALLGESIGKGEPPIRARKRVALTGTPIVNRPVEAWPILAWLEPDKWGNFWAYAKKYCGAYHNGWGWDFSGATNLDDLNRRLKATVMLRRTKGEVLKELPEKIRQVLELPANGASDLIRREQEVWNQLQDEIYKARAALEVARAESDEAFSQALANLNRVILAGFSEISKLRHELALAKVDASVEHIRDVLESRDKVVVWVHHRDVAEALRSGLTDFNPVMVLGGTSAESRAEAVRRFQEDPSVRVFIGGITAAAEGITLTAADVAVFVELDWRPGKLLQAEDRIHRIGQTRGVLIQYLVFDGSLDAVMAHKVAQKMEVIAKAVDGGWRTDSEDAGGLMSLVEEEDMVRAPSREEEVPQLSDQAKFFVLTALRYLAQTDVDRARVRNDVGFNRYDTHLGHQLASRDYLTDRQAVLGLRLVKKYRRQLAHLLDQAPSEVIAFLG